MTSTYTLRQCLKLAMLNQTEKEVRGSPHEQESGGLRLKHGADRAPKSFSSLVLSQTQKLTVEG